MKALNQPTVAVPQLHRDERLAALCPDLKWVCPGLESEGSLEVNWPFSPDVVKDIVRELETICQSGMTGEEVRAVHLLEQATSRAREELREMRGALGLEEMTGGHFGDLARRAQRYLLFVWFQEEQQREIFNLSRAYAEKSRMLGEMLGDAEASTGVLPASSLHAQLPDWKQVLERIAVFVPPSVALCTEDFRIINDLQERGFCLKTPDEANIPCPEALVPIKKHLRAERIALWKVLGYSELQRNKPWLDSEYSFILIMDTPHDA